MILSFVNAYLCFCVINKLCSEGILENNVSGIEHGAPLIDRFADSIVCEKTYESNLIKRWVACDS